MLAAAFALSNWETHALSTAILLWCFFYQTRAAIQNNLGLMVEAVKNTENDMEVRLKELEKATHSKVGPDSCLRVDSPLET